MNELFSAESKAPPSNAHLTYRGGPLLPNVEVFTIFWGPKWKTGSYNTIRASINSFFIDVLSGPLMAQMSEYDTPNYKFGNGKLLGSIVVTTAVPVDTVTDNYIKIHLQNWIRTNKAFPKIGPNTLYFLYVQDGITVTADTDASCKTFCGYHDACKSGAYYAVMPYPACAGCLGGLSPLNVLTATSSHELCEAMTDPIPGSGWYDDNNGEIGDICAWNFKELDMYNLQLEWSNKAKKCI